MFGGECAVINDVQGRVRKSVQSAVQADNHEMMLEMTKQYADARKFTQAIKTGRQCLKVVQGAAKPESTPEKTWKDYVTNVNATCYYVIGHSSEELKDYPNAVTNLETSVKYYKRNEMAYYRMAESY